jgi:CheY-like chemotaxis protein
VTAAATAGEALHLFKQEVFDALVADVGMPEQDGYHLIRAVRGVPERGGHRIPAIAVTAYAGVRDREQALEAGYDCHLSKPIDPEQLIKAVATATELESS